MARPRSSRQEKTQIGAALVFFLLSLWASLAQAQQPDQGNGNAPNQQPLLRIGREIVLSKNTVAGIAKREHAKWWGVRLS